MKYAKRISAVILAVLIMTASSLFCVNAAEDTLDVDGRLTYQVGDTLTYSICLEDPTEKVMGIQMYVFYDQEYLKINDDTVDFPKFPGAVYNTALENYFTFNWTNVTRLADFSEKAPLFTASFEVLKPGETKITYLIEEMYSTDMTYLKEYTLTAEYSQNGTVIKKDDPPVVENDPEKNAEHKGQFINYEDGRGENNPNANQEEHQQDNEQQKSVENKNENAVNNNNNADNNNNQNKSGQLATDANGNYVDENGKVLATDASGNFLDANGNVFNPSSATDDTQPVNVGLIAIIVALVLIVIAIGVIIVLKIKNNKNSKDAEDASDESSESDDNQIMNTDNSNETDNDSPNE